MTHGSHTSLLVVRFASRLRAMLHGFAYAAPTPLARSFHSRLMLSTRVPTVLSYRGTGISTCCPSATAPALALGPDLPRADQLYSGNLGYSAGGFPPSSRYSFRHSLFDAVHGSFRCRFLPHPMLLYRCTSYIPGLRQCVSAPDIFGAGPLD